MFPGCETIMDERQNIRSKLTPAEIQRFRAILLEKRDEILGDVTSMEFGALRRERSDLSNVPIHLADVGTDNYEIENTLELTSSERKLIVEIDDALERMDEGTYGICQGSGKPIPKKRLEAIPWARYCVEYASLLEKGLVDKDIPHRRSNYYYGNDD